jgi:hypothetical protein
MKNLMLRFVFFLNLLYSSTVYAQTCPVFEDWAPTKLVRYNHPSTEFYGTVGYLNCFVAYNHNTGIFEYEWGGLNPGVNAWGAYCTCDIFSDRTWFRKLAVCNVASLGSCNNTIILSRTDASSAASTWSQTASWVGGQTPNLATSTVFVDKANFALDVNNLVLNSPLWLVILANRSLDINAGINFTCNSVIQIYSGGQLTNHGNLKGSGEIIGNFVNFGHFASGNSAGTFTITGDYTAQSTAVHDMEIASTSSYDIINVSGIATLGGTLNVSLLNSFVPNIGDQFTLMTYGSKTGTFPTVNLPSLPAGRFWHLIYNPTNIVLEVLSSALTVELLDFKAKNTEGGNLLTWQTAMEQNLSHFDIERSGDGKIFEKIAETKAQGQAAIYEYLDKHPLSITGYYRLKINDLDGKTHYSNVISIFSKGKGFSVKTYPNPFGNSLTIDLSTYKKTDVTIELIDILGRQIFVKKVENTEGVLSVPISTVGLPNGTYFLKVSDGQQTIQQKVIKN